MRKRVWSIVLTVAMVLCNIHGLFTITAAERVILHVEPTFELRYAGRFALGVSYVVLADETEAFITVDGEVLPHTSELYDQWSAVVYPTRVSNLDELISNYGLTSVKEGIANSSGELVVPTSQYNAYTFSDGVFTLKNNDDKYGCIDANGNIIVPFQYDYAYGFSEGLAWFFEGDYWDGNIYDTSNAKAGCIDTSGNIVIPFIFDGEDMQIPFSPRGHYGFNDGISWAKKDGKVMFVDRQGVAVVSLDAYDFVDDSFKNGFLMVGHISNEVLKLGYVDKNGVEVVPCIYEQFSSPMSWRWDSNYFCFNEGHAWVVSDGKYGILKDTEYESNNKPTNSYVYDEFDPGADVIPPVSELGKITDTTSAVKVVTDFVKTLTAEQKQSATGADRIKLFAEAAVAQVSSKTVTGDIVIDRPLVTELKNRANDTLYALDSVLNTNGVLDLREMRSTVRVKYDTTTKATIKVNENYSDAEADTVKVETSFVNLYLNKDQVATNNIEVENKGTNKVSVSFSNTDTKSTVTVSFPNADSNNKYTAVADENGNPVGGKYNPATGSVEAKISASGVYSVVNNPKDFADIKDKSQEMQDAIKLLASKGVINGTSETTFSPDDTISRAEIAALIIRMLGKLDPNADGGFGDVTHENWYFGTAGSSKQYGIINGFEDGTFRGTIAIPKDQIFAVSARVLRNEMRYTTPSDIHKYLPYSDADSIPDWAKVDVAVASMANLVMRRVDGSFDPNEQMTRGNAAIGIKRLFDKVW